MAFHDHQSRKRVIVQLGRELGFARVGVAGVGPLPHETEFHEWVASGMAGTMSYMERTQSMRAHPKLLLAEAESAIVVLSCYSDGKPEVALPTHGQIARYARGPDYHVVLKRKLSLLAARLQETIQERFVFRIVVDSAPLLERELAVAAGLGFIGKNTMLITPGLGSFTVIGVLLTSLKLDALEPTPHAHRCGQCTLCLTACPTRAFPRPYVLDARRCVSYLTIEHRDEIEIDLQNAMNDRVFGCDECQTACPYNTPTKHWKAEQLDPDLKPLEPAQPIPTLETLLTLRSGDYRRFTKSKALGRASRRMWIRNAAIALRNKQKNEN